MRHIVATLIVIGLLVAASESVDVYGQDACGFVGGFARLRELVGADKIGACLEDEHFNVENGNAEQRTTGGLLVWRKADNFTAFTDGGTTWVNGPDGLQSRPNNERFSWETDPVTTPGAAPVASAPPPPTATPRPASSPAPASAGAGTTTSASAASAPAAAASPAAIAATPTKAATPTPAVTAKWSEKPDDVDTGGDAHFEVETNASKGTCSLGIAFRGTADAGFGSVDIDDGKCEWTINIPAGSKTGKAKVHADISGKEGTARVDDEFEVKEGDSTLVGDTDIELEGDDLPDDVGVGEEMKVAIKTNVKNKGTCDLTVAWPKYTSVAAEQQAPNGDGKCSWKMIVPVEIPKKGTGTITVTVRKTKNSTSYRQLTKEFEVKK